MAWPWRLALAYCSTGSAGWWGSRGRHLVLQVQRTTGWRRGDRLMGRFSLKRRSPRAPPRRCRRQTSSRAQSYYLVVRPSAPLFKSLFHWTFIIFTGMGPYHMCICNVHITCMAMSNAMGLLSSSPIPSATGTDSVVGRRYEHLAPAVATRVSSQI
jgi:hypothetical protein